MNQDPYQPPTIEHKEQRPSGLISKRSGNILMIAVIAVIVIIVLWTGMSDPRQPRKTPNFQNPSDLPSINSRKVDELREEWRRLEEARQQQRELLEEQKNGGLVEDQMGMNNHQADPEEQMRNQIKLDALKREANAAFASNVALSYRQKEQTNAAPAPPPPLPNYPAPPQAAPSSTNGAAPAPERNDSRRNGESKHEVDDSYNRAEGDRYRILEGTVIEGVLVNGINADFTGPVSVQVTTPIYTHNRQRLLIPEGSRILGEALRVQNAGETRVAIPMHRLITPDGYSISLDQWKGLSQSGESGLRDKTDNHYLRMFGTAAMIGLLAGFSRGSYHGSTDYSSWDDYRSGFSQAIAASGMRIMERTLNMPPTITIRPGWRMKLIASADILVPAYEDHRMRPDLSEEVKP